MNSDAASVATPAQPPIRLGLMWTVLFTILWTWLIYSLPALPESGFPALGVRLLAHGLIAVGLWLGLENTALTPEQRRATWLVVMVPFTLWAALAWTAAINGAFRTGASFLPLLPAAILLPVIVGTPVLMLSKRVGQLLDAMPTTSGRKGAIFWNIFGLADFAVAIALGMAMSPGPFQLIVPDDPSMAVDTFPNVLTPAFVVPSSILLHVLSLRQLRRRSRAATV
ncbi:MFS transporter [Bradyrhizobium sp. CCBAU 11361]|uniref:MFS transporter n=1 Tax=Bradyrhizobium sp. CCBAU 11361 TaxID=1630812 RepID=UPI00230417E6|nr:MFS transporter [Bradyrhizobium sp. CCBAU 11361]MDA9491046.1 MFS transporter [Bradyrhizobium sp. CCBAU 11361]